MKTKWENVLEDSLVKHFYENQSLEEKNEGYNNRLSFGTAGIRGKFGLGEGRLNKFTIQKVALGLANYLNEYERDPSIVIHFDTRHLSTEFAQIIAEILASHKIKVFLADTYKTTPDLSYAVRYLQTSAGVMITASHNPKDYNGIKVYGKDGAQLGTELSETLSEYINKLGDPLSLNININSTEIQNNIYKVEDKVKEKYFEEVFDLVGEIPNSDLKVVFTSLHGTSVPTVPELLTALDFNNYTLVDEQCSPDPNFSSVESANPEDHQAFKQAIKKAKVLEADLLISTDPDADRIGIVERDVKGNIYYFNGNQIGALLLSYRIKQTEHLNNRVIFQSIVSSELSKMMATKYNIKCQEVLTGFKYIAEGIRNLNSEDNFILGYEESYGFLAKPFVRDKDAIQIVPLIIKYASELKNQGLMLKDELEAIYKEVGHHQDKLFAHTFEGESGKTKIDMIMSNMRNNPPKSIANLKVLVVEDFQKQQSKDMVENTKRSMTLPKANVIKIHFNEGFIALRPSGTEPKIKLYVSLKVENFDALAQKINDFIIKI